MEAFSLLLAICAGYSPVTYDFPAQRPVTRSLDVFFDLRLNKRLSKKIVRLVIRDAIAPLLRHFSAMFTNFQIRGLCRLVKTKRVCRITEKYFCKIIGNRAWNVIIVRLAHFPWTKRPTFSHTTLLILILLTDLFGKFTNGIRFTSSLSGQFVPIHIGELCCVKIWDNPANEKY